MELLVGSLELYVTLNYHILLLSPPYLWVQETTFPLHLDGSVYRLHYTPSSSDLFLYYIIKTHFQSPLQGKKNPGTDRASVELFLDKVLKAKEMKIDKYVYISLCFFFFLTIEFMNIHFVFYF